MTKRAVIPKEAAPVTIRLQSCPPERTLLSLPLRPFCTSRAASPPSSSPSRRWRAAPATPPSPRPAILRLSQRNEPADLVPALADVPDDFFVNRALSEGLVAPTTARDGSPVPAAADRWETSSDGLTRTFHLREDARWSDGEPVTAADFVASYQRALSPGTAAPKANLLFPVKNARAFYLGQLTDFATVGFLAPDPHVLEVTLERPMPQLLTYAASGTWIPANPRVVARFGRRWTLPENYVGNGPFLLVEWKPGQRITVRHSPRYHAAAGVRLDEIQFLHFSDTDAEDRAYRDGQIDVTMAVPYTKVVTYFHERPSRAAPRPPRRDPLCSLQCRAATAQRRPGAASPVAGHRPGSDREGRPAFGAGAGLPPAAARAPAGRRHGFQSFG